MNKKLVFCSVSTFTSLLCSTTSETNINFRDKHFRKMQRSHSKQRLAQLHSPKGDEPAIFICKGTKAMLHDKNKKETPSPLWFIEGLTDTHSPAPSSPARLQGQKSKSQKMKPDLFIKLTPILESLYHTRDSAEEEAQLQRELDKLHRNKYEAEGWLPYSGRVSSPPHPVDPEEDRE